MKWIFIAFVLLMALASQAEVAIQTAVDTTTAEELYLCNAGLRHPTLQNEQECLDLSSGEVCSPHENDPKKPACVCRAKSNYGDQIIGWNQDGEYANIIGTNDWMSLFSTPNSFANKLSRLDISLGSENLGAEYSVRFCYLGPQEVLKTEGTTTKDLTEGKYQVEVSLAGANYNKALDKVYFSYQCDYRYRGNQSGPRRSNDHGPSKGIVENDDSANYTIFGDSPGARPGTVNFLRRALSLNSTSSQVPRFCVFEFKFKELAGKNLGRNINATQANFTGKLRICKQGTCPSGL
ncbi:hypothetical protein B9G69_009735 [Bdellovibrio sp. SKB1291214]|uniref:hypothetical protein n=1 Tax=Bdellovibrio sp. SKB1291214 TaxID=1732569 RepID=UPI000B51CFD3|nr:hypothetical protein [Bdellovibrio sp. SKB1291214]UYL07326.1 hypothetical protein B9G69_009735 [Bdellovibrio sp. SKB1291214]